MTPEEFRRTLKHQPLPGDSGTSMDPLQPTTKENLSKINELELDELIIPVCHIPPDHEVNMTESDKTFFLDPKDSTIPLQNMYDKISVYDFQLWSDSEDVIPYQDFVRTTFAWTNNVDLSTACETLDTLHCALGLVSEYIELENELILYQDMIEDHDSSDEELSKQQLAVEKEIGDICYYSHMLANIHGMILSTSPGKRGGSGRALEDFLDAVKKVYFYKHGVNLKPYINTFWIQFISNLPESFPQQIGYYIYQNKIKLMKRYPSGSFNSQDAQEKKDNT